MDDRSLREYAENIYKGIRGYTLSKALSLFPKYYPKIAFYYTEILTKQQNEFSLRMIQGLGIDKGRALLNELNILNRKIVNFYANAKFKLDQSYKRIEAATNEDRSNVAKKEKADRFQIVVQTRDFFAEGADLLSRIYDEAQKYNFKSLANDIIKAEEMNYQTNHELFDLNRKFLEYLKRSI